MNKPLAVVSCPIDTYSGYGARSRDFVKRGEYYWAICSNESIRRVWT